MLWFVGVFRHIDFLKGVNMKTEKLENLTFASGAEAVAHYYSQGFQTFYDFEGGRLMRQGDDEVLIRKLGFLLWEASRVRLIFH